MRFRKVLALRGPNCWANFPVLEAWVELEKSGDLPSDQLPGLGDRIMAWLPSLAENRHEPGHRGGYFERLRAGIGQEQILEHVALELQRLLGMGVEFGRARATSEPGVCRVAVAYEEEAVGRAALEAGRQMLHAAVCDLPFDVAAELAKLRELHTTARLEPGAAAIRDAAGRRGIPVRRLTDQGLLVLGHGARQRRVLGARTDRTGALAESIADDQALTVSLLHAVGVPSPSEPGVTAVATHDLTVVGGRLVSAIERGDVARDVSDRVHAETADHAEAAARVVGLDVARVEVAASDIARPLEAQGGAILAVRPAPTPGPSEARRVGDAIVAAMFAPGDEGRIPTVAVTGVNGKTTTTRIIAHILAEAGLRVGMTCTDGIFVGDRKIEGGDCSGPRSARAILLNPVVEAAILETARGGILREGLGFDLCDVAVVTNIGEGDHLGISDIGSLDKLARVKRTIVDVVRPGTGHAVLNAADPLVVAMATECRGEVVFFARDPEQASLAAHREHGGKAAFVRGDAIVVAAGHRETVVATLPRIPLTYQGRVGFQVENALAAAAACWALDVDLAAIRAGLETFRGDAADAPGRFNVLHKHGATVIVDYAHNASARLALIEALNLFPHERRVIVASADGDRTDESIVRQGQILGDGFDRVVLYEDRNLRGRAPGTIFALLRRGLEAGRMAKAVETIRGEAAAIEVALRSLAPGDLVVVQSDEDVEVTRAVVEQVLASLPAPVETSEPEPCSPRTTMALQSTS